MFMRFVALLSAFSLLAGCGGGGGGSAVPAAQKPITSGSGKATVTIALKVPLTRGASSGKRRPAFVAPTTASYSVSINTTPTPAVVNQNNNVCPLSTVSSEVAGLANENFITTAPYDGSVWLSAQNAYSTNNIEGIYRDQTVAVNSDTYTPIALGGDMSGNIWGGTTTTSGFITKSNFTTTGNVGAGYISFASSNPYSERVAQGNDGNVYFNELNIDGFTPSGAFGKIVSGVYASDVAVTGTPAGMVRGLDKMIWYVDTTSHMIAQFNASTGVTTEYPAPGTLTYIPIIAPSITNNDVYALAQDATHALSLIDIAEGGATTTVQGITGPYDATNVTSLTQGVDYGWWMGTAGNSPASLVRLAIGASPYAFSPASVTNHISGVTSGGDGKIYYLEDDVGKVGELALSETCSSTVQIPPGSYTATVTTYDAPNQGGNILGTYAGPITVATDTANNISLTVNGVLSRIVLTTAHSSFGGCAPSTQQLNVQGLDFDGNIIVPPAGFTDSSGNPLSIGLSSSHGTPITPASVTQTGVVSLGYSSSFSNFTDTITATASGGAAAPVTFNLLDQGCG